jgi:uncharacterized membrane protein YgcG
LVGWFVGWWVVLGWVRLLSLFLLSVTDAVVGLCHAVIHTDTHTHTHTCMQVASFLQSKPSKVEQAIRQSQQMQKQQQQRGGKNKENGNGSSGGSSSSSSSSSSKAPMSGVSALADHVAPAVKC